MIKIEKYKNDGWGISQEGFSDLLSLIKQHDKQTLSILEFGSGISTQFLVDVVESNVKQLQIESYDNDPKWAFKQPEKYDFLNLKIRNLVECTDKEYANMFLKKEYHKDKMKIKKTAPTTRQKNCFYEIKEDDLCNEYDIVILDGPNGNGRSFAFLHLNTILKPGSFIFIDDYLHYPFVETLKHFFDVKLFSEKNNGLSQQYVIYEILKKRKK